MDDDDCQFVVTEPVAAIVNQRVRQHSGRSRQGDPVRNRQMIPSNVVRWSFHGRPRRPASCGITVSRTSHNSSLATRYDKYAVTFLGGFTLAMVILTHRANH